jgi:hypothetical protein
VCRRRRWCWRGRSHKCVKTTQSHALTNPVHAAVFLSTHLLGAGRLAMRRWCPAVLLGCVVALFVLVAAVECVVAYDKKVVLIDGQMRILFSGSIHYPRSTPDVTAFYKISSPPTIPWRGLWLRLAVS